jgi:fibronectin-binding autotransporter adhesin
MGINMTTPLLNSLPASSTAKLLLRLWPSRFRCSITLAALCFLSRERLANGQTWNVSSGASWNSAGNWNPSNIPNSVGAAVTFNSAASGSNPAQTVNSTPTLDGSKTVGSITFNNDAANSLFYTISTGSGGPLVFDQVGSSPATIVVNSVTGSSGNNTISVATTLNDTLVATVNNVTASSAAGALNLITTMSGAGGFTKQGDGMATFGTGAKTYTGPTVLSGGRMRMSSAGAPTATSGFTISAGGQLTLITSANFTFGVGSLNLNGVGAVSGPFAVFPGAIRNDRGIVLVINNPVLLQSDSLIHVQATSGTGANPNPTGSVTLAGSVSGPGRLALTAPNSDADQGSLILTAANTYSGGTLVNGGLLVASGASATFGTGDVIVDNAASPTSIARVVIQAGVADAIADTATLSLAGGGAAGVADRNYADLGTGVNEVVGLLKLGGAIQPAGTYGSTASSAAFQSDEYFAGAGIITALGPPVLTIASVPPNVIVSWPNNVPGFSLQQVDTLSSTNNWVTNNTPVIVSGTTNTVTEPATNAATFFRLKR